MASEAIPLPPPYKGQNDQLPEFSVQNPFCIRVQNFEIKNGFLRLRAGNKRFGTQSPAVPYLIAPYSDKLIAVLTNGGTTAFYNIASGAFVLISTSVFTSAIPFKSFYFGSRLFLFGDSAANAKVYDGATIAAAGYTWPASFVPYGGCVHKNRAYFIGYGTSKYAYSGIEAISGTTTEVDLSTVVSAQARISVLASLSLSENATQQNIFLVVCSNGDLLGYEGSFPNSASWNLITRTQVSPPASYSSFIAAKGDIFLLCTSEIISLRGVLARGYNAEKQEGIGAAIANRYRQIYQIIATQGTSELAKISGAYDSTNDRLIISFPYYVDPDDLTLTSALSLLIYDFSLGAWYEFYQPMTSGYIASAAFFEGRAYALGYDGANSVGVQIGGKSGYIDDTIDTTSNTRGIEFYLRSAPHPLNRFGVVKADGIEAVVKSDIYPAINVKLIGDLGATNTAAQTTSGNGSNVSKVFANLGLEANTIQYEISGTSTSSTYGIELYATNLWVTPSSGVSR